MERVEVDGLQIAYQRAGSGPPLVLLHGHVGDGPVTFRGQLDGLCDKFTVVAWDAPGAGRSSDPPEGFGLDGYADCLAGFVDRLDLGRPHVLGLSFGGILALALYGRHPAVTRSPVLASAYAGWGGSLPAEVRRIAPGRGPPPVDPRDQAGPPARGRPCTNIEAPEAFNGAVRSFLGNLAEGAGRG